ncbi:TetR/AcrR family transcriptional regulator [Maridesulfovibrio sp.]|uniref:TetR/AcrR family transcriptional regulator n=1 Tax=Maridesulfovibrio sp. TaxID=2795000 RepID=UPI0029F4A844|nr:TetR/AcrR family transcriptional regulator [Maridesulfovibrio sp.]
MSQKDNGPIASKQMDGQPKTRETRRMFLLDTAEAVFLKKGYEAATVNDILEAASLSKGGFYHYFKSKNEVLDALKSRYTRWFLDTVEAKVNTFPASLIDKRFDAWIRAYADTYLSTVALHDLVYHSVHTQNNNEDRIAITRQIELLLEEGVARGAWTLYSPHLTATIIYSAIHGVLDDAIARDLKNTTAIIEQTSASLRLLLQ